MARSVTVVELGFYQMDHMQQISNYKPRVQMRTSETTSSYVLVCICTYFCGLIFQHILKRAYNSTVSDLVTSPNKLGLLIQIMPH